MRPPAKSGLIFVPANQYKNSLDEDMTVSHCGNLDNYFMEHSTALLNYRVSYIQNVICL